MYMKNKEISFHLAAAVMDYLLIMLPFISEWGQDLIITSMFSLDKQQVRCCRT